MFVCSATTVGAGPIVVFAPLTMAPKRLPGRTMSIDKRLIADLRGAIMFTTKGGQPQNDGAEYPDDIEESRNAETAVSGKENCLRRKRYR